MVNKSRSSPPPLGRGEGTGTSGAGARTFFAAKETNGVAHLLDLSHIGAETERLPPDGGAFANNLHMTQGVYVQSSGRCFFCFENIIY